MVRSALFAASQQAMHWPGVLKNIVFLGTPHHGSPLERAGNWIDVVLGSTAYSRPFAKLGNCAARASPTCVMAMCSTPTGRAMTIRNA